MSDVPKSTQDRLGRWLSSWRNAVVAREVRSPMLDIACGNNILARRFPNGLGVDVQDHGDADHVVPDYASLPFTPGSFATITIVASLNYTEDPVTVLRECERLLRPDGRIVMTLLSPRVGGVWHRFREPWAMRRGFSRADVEAMAGAAALMLVRRRRFMLGLNTLYVLERA